MESLSTVEKALDVLSYLHTEPGGRGVSEIGRALALPKSTTHRLLSSLSRRGFVERDGRGVYRPGMALVSLGLGVLEREPVVAAARPVLEELARDLGETPFLAATRAGRLHVLDKEEGAGFLRASPRVGAEIPVHATAVGKLVLAFAPESIELPPAAELERFTARTCASRAGLLSEVERARTRGWASNTEEWIPDLAGVAAPILAGGRFVAALAIAGPTSHIETTPRSRFVLAVRKAAERIAARLEGRVA